MQFWFLVYVYLGLAYFSMIIIMWWKSPKSLWLYITFYIAAAPCLQVIFKTGTRQRARLVDINAIAQKLGPAVSDALIGLHAYTGCDSVSAFSGKGKSSGLAIIKTDEVLASVMSRLGQSFTVDASLLAACETFTCSLYGFPDSTEINAVRYKLLCANATTPERLPPSQNALKQHVHRANYQAAVWRGALRNDLVQPTPVGNGWVQSSDGKASQWCVILFNHI